MASTPSASALSAVLRCRGNIWTRNPPTKRPATSVYSLGLAGGVVRDSPAERTSSNQTSSWVAFLQGERVGVGRRLAVAYEPPRVDKAPRETESTEINKLYDPKLSRSAGDAHSAVQNALVRQLARKLTFNLHRTCAQIIQIIKYDTCITHIRKITFVREISELPGIWKVSITCPYLVVNAGQIPSFVLSGWSTLKSTCLSLTALVSECTCLKLLCRSSDDAPQHLLCRQDDALQASGQINSPTDVSTKDSSCFGQMITEDRPD